MIGNVSPPHLQNLDVVFWKWCRETGRRGRWWGVGIVFDTSQEATAVFFLVGGLHYASDNTVMQSALRRCEDAVSKRKQKIIIGTEGLMTRRGCRCHSADANKDEAARVAETEP